MDGWMDRRLKIRELAWRVGMESFICIIAIRNQGLSWVLIDHMICRDLFSRMAKIMYGLSTRTDHSDAICTV